MDLLNLIEVLYYLTFQIRPPASEPDPFQPAIPIPWFWYAIVQAYSVNAISPHTYIGI